MGSSDMPARIWAIATNAARSQGEWTGDANSAFWGYSRLGAYARTVGVDGMPERWPVLVLTAYNELIVAHMANTQPDYRMWEVEEGPSYNISDIDRWCDLVDAIKVMFGDS